MDQQTPAANPTPPAHSFQQPIKKRSNFLVILVKIILFFLIAVGLLFGGFYLGTTNTAEPTPTTTPTPIATTTSSLPTEVLPSPTPASQNTKPVKAGLGDDTTVFEPYTIDVPAGWTDARETSVDAGIDKLTLTKNGYSVTIYQAPMGGGGCIYDKDEPVALAQLYTNFADIGGKSGQFRRSWTESEGQSITYIMCQKNQNESYSGISDFGTIKIVSPNPANAEMLVEIDGMIASIIKQ